MNECIKTSIVGETINLETDPKTSDARAAAIQGAYEILTAQLAYCQKIVNVLSAEKNSEMLKDFVAYFKTWKLLSPELEKNASLFSETVRAEILKEVQEHCKTYEKRLNDISENENHPHIMDALYHVIRIDRFLAQQYISRHQAVWRKKNKSFGHQSTAPALPKIEGIDLWHFHFRGLDECLSLLEPVLSEGERAFVRDSLLSDPPNGVGCALDIPSTRHFNKLWQYLCGVLEVIPRLFVPEIATDKLTPKYQQEFNEIRAELHRLHPMLKLPMDSLQWHEMYHKVSDNIDRYNILKKNLETLIAKYKPIEQASSEASSIKSAPGEKVKRRAKKRNKAKTHIPPSPASHSVLAVAQSTAVPLSAELSSPGGNRQSAAVQTIAKETKALANALAPDQAAVLQGTISQLASISEPSVPAINTTRDYHQLKTAEWKALVAKRREDKEKPTVSDIKEKNETLRSATARDEADLQGLARIKMQIAFLLLHSLNPHHLDILRQIHSVPTPHLEISYNEILSLFNGKRDSLGRLTEEGGGSHKKITIRDTLGYFYQSSTSDEETKTAKETVGGTFKPHRNNSVGKTEDKLPRVAVEMIRETLDRANITHHHLHLFLDIRQKLSRTLGRQVSLDRMVEMAENIQVKLLFCLAVNEKTRYGTSQQSSLLALQNIAGSHSQEEIIKTIFSFE